MKKLIPVVILIICITGCHKKKEHHVTSIIKKTNDTAIAIHYPEFQYSKLDSAIKKEVDKIYYNFQKEYAKYESELNIDYEYNILNKRYVNVALSIFINSKSLANPINQIKVFHYDVEQKTLLTLKDIILKEELVKLIPKIKTILVEKYKDCLLMDKMNEIIIPNFDNYQEFNFDDNNLIFYFDPYKLTAGYCDIIKIELSLDQVNLNIPLERGVFEETEILFPIKKENNISINKPSIALTFDDGPSKYTNDIIELLKRHDARATFFVIGNKVKLYQKTIQKMTSYGNEIGNHSYNHKWLTKVTDDELVNQINKTQNIIQEITGKSPTLFRPTYGSINQHLRDKMKLEIVMWTVDTSDWKTTNSKLIAKRALNSIKEDDIILMHDTHKQTYEALKIMIPKLKEKGYQFVTVSELNEIRILRQSSR